MVARKATLRRLSALEARAPILDGTRRQPFLGELAPAVGEQGERGNGAQRVAIEHVDIEDAADALDAPVGGEAIDEADAVAGGNHPLLQHAIIPAGTAAVLHAQRDAGHLEAQVEAETGLAALRHLDQCGADAEAVTDRDVALGQAEGRDILPEGAMGIEQRMIAEIGSPGGIVIAGIVMHRLVDPAMDAGIALFVTGQAERGEAERAIGRLLGDRAGDGLRAERTDRGSVEREDGGVGEGGTP